MFRLWPSLLSLMIAAGSYGQWFKVSESDYFTDIHFFDALTGLAVGEDGKVLRTIDGGVNWQQSMGGPEGLHTLCFVDDSVGYVAGGYQMLKTVDGGITWALYPGVEDEYICFPSRDTGFAWTEIKGELWSGWRVTLYRTVDGGLAWDTVKQHIYYFPYADIDLPTGQCVFTDSRRGYGLHQGVLRQTSDGGINWTPAPVDSSYSLNTVCFVDKKTGYAAGNDGILLRTTDAGQSWMLQGSAVGRDLRSVCFADALTALVYGDSGTILTTLDGGNSWSVSHNTLGFTPEGHSFTDISNGFGFTDQGNSLLHTMDGGLSWDTLKKGIPDKNLKAVWFMDASTGLVAGEGGIFRTTDGGSNWDWKYDAGEAVINSIHFCTKDMGYAVCDRNGTILKTVDGGETWYVQTNAIPGLSGSLHSISFADEWHGCTVGSSGRILLTVDGGSTWSAVVSGTDIHLYAVHYLCKDIAFAAGGRNGINIILKTLDAGLTWSTVWSRLYHPLNDIFFLDTNTGFACGNGGLLVRTCDGGATWQYQELGTSEHFTAIHFIDAQHAYLLSLDSIRYTSDGGMHWTVQADGTRRELHDIFFPAPDTGYAVGKHATVCKTENGGHYMCTAGRRQMRPGLEVFPNPAHNRVNIRISSMEDERMPITAIRLFDISGRLMRQLFPGAQEAMMHVDDLRNGLYILRVWLGPEAASQRLVISH